MKAISLAVLSWCLVVGVFSSSSAFGESFVTESERSIPVVDRADVVVVGGSTGAVAAAVAAAEEGAEVFLAAQRPHLGGDMCDTLRLWLEPGEEPTTPLAREVYGDSRATTPLRVKKVLDEALVEAGVEFLFGCYATDVLEDDAGRPAGIVMANRAGRQAVVAKTIIDATHRATVARMAGAKVSEWLGGELTVKRVVIGAEEPNEGLPCRQVDVDEGKLSERGVFEYTLKVEVDEDSIAGFARADQGARDATRRPGQLQASEKLFYVPPEAIAGRGPWSGFEGLSTAPFQPKGVDGVYVLGGCADLPREAAEALLRPVRLMSVGRFIGRAAAGEAARVEEPAGVTCPARVPSGRPDGEVREVLRGPRPTSDIESRIPYPERGLPVLGEYDVVVLGGGTSGCAAAIGAARRGARTLVLEYQGAPGGTGTLGMIGRSYAGRRVGFAEEVPFPARGEGLHPKMEWYRRNIREAGGEVWFHVLGCGALVDGERVKGVVVATPWGRGVVLAKVAIDSTGNADLAVAAGADSMYGSDVGDIALQGAGLPERPLGSRYINTDYLLVDESDMLDVWRALVGARMTMGKWAFDGGSFIQTRERRRVVGDHILRYLDQVARRTYPDSIVLSRSDYDSHGYPDLPYFAFIPHTEESRKANHPAPGGKCYTPYRCLLPAGLDGMLVTGLGISMERDASAMVRMQYDLSNQGYAAGVAAAMAAEQGVGTRGIDIRALQKHLVEVGNLPEHVLEHEDSFPPAERDIREAVRLLPDENRSGRREGFRALAVVLSHAEEALPSLREAHRAAEGDARLTYARVLGCLGAKEAVPDLIEALDEVEEWDPKILQGGMAEYAHLPTWTDSLILALGRTRDERALPAILRKARTLDREVTLSHHRAVALALERIGDPRGAPMLAEVLNRPGMSGHDMTELEPQYDKPRGKRRRTGPLREIVLARALYRCGDNDGLGERILREYTRDIRGLFARHAHAVLADRDR